MKNKSAILFLSLSLCGLVFISSCKKKDDPAPSPTAATDNVDMGSNSSTTIDVLANDTYSGSVSVSVSANATYGTVVVNSDKTITYTTKTNFFGTATYTYTVTDDNGSGSGNIVIKVGTDAQIKTYSILKTYQPDDILILYAVDGDSSTIYQSNYGAFQIYYLGFSINKLSVYSNNVMPDVGNYTYSINGDGNIVTKADSDGSPVIFSVLDHFTASAKKHDGSGYMTVKGFSIQYGTHKLDYTTRVL